jgi:hypothetical protein
VSASANPVHKSTQPADLLAGALAIIPLAIILAKSTGHPLSELLASTLSLASLPGETMTQLAFVLLVPLGAVVVAFFRLTLGVRLLGPFRPILIAIALQLTGLVTGLGFLALVMAAIVLIRPLLRGAGLPYFARVLLLVGAVATLVIATVLMSRLAGLDSLLRVAFIPIVVLCLVAESFAKTLNNEGPRSAVWRAVTTVLAALAIGALAALPGLLDLLVEFPELVLLALAMVVLVGTHLDYRLLAFLNPEPRVRRHRRRPVGARRPKGAVRNARPTGKTFSDPQRAAPSSRPVGAIRS